MQSPHHTGQQWNQRHVQPIDFEHDGVTASLPQSSPRRCIAVSKQSRLACRDSAASALVRGFWPPREGTYIHTHIYYDIYIRIYIHIYTQYIYNIRVCMYLCMYECMYVWMYVCERQWGSSHILRYFMLFFQNNIKPQSLSGINYCGLANQMRLDVARNWASPSTLRLPKRQVARRFIPGSQDAAPPIATA